MIDAKPRMTCPGWVEAQEHLSRADPALKRIIRAVGPCTLAPRRDYFAALCQSIITQQISTRVAMVIYGRFRDLFPRRRPVPERLLELRDGDLRPVGLSRQKMVYLRGLAQAFADGSVRSRTLRHMDDEQVVQALIPLKGVGRWTAEMFLIFVLNRGDLLPVDDLGLKKSVKDVYGLKELPTADELRRLAEPWRPYRSIATWYLWRGGALQVLPTAGPPSVR